jgi:hypothetical protein
MDHLQGKNKNSLRQADVFGLSDISYSLFAVNVAKLIDNLKSEYGANYSDSMVKASEIIINEKSPKALSPILEIISKIPEMKLFITGEGAMKPEQIAKVVIGWVNGRSIRVIAEEARYEGVDSAEFLGKCIQYINSRLTTFLPWGISVYQQLAKDKDTEAAENLPSFIYYGVNSIDLVVLSKLGVPRFAARRVKRLLQEQHPSLEITVSTMPELRKHILGISPNEYDFTVDGNLVKEIVDKSI